MEDYTSWRWHEGFKQYYRYELSHMGEGWSLIWSDGTRMIYDYATKSWRNANSVTGPLLQSGPDSITGVEDPTYSWRNANSVTGPPLRSGADSIMGVEDLPYEGSSKMSLAEGAGEVDVGGSETGNDLTASDEPPSTQKAYNKHNEDLAPQGSSPENHESPHYMAIESVSLHCWRDIQACLPADWQWDVEFHVTLAMNGRQHGCWTCTPLELTKPKNYPLTIAQAPVIIPVEYHWPPTSGVTPPPDPRRVTPIDCRAKMSLELVKDIFLTYEGSVGFYVLVNGLLQVIVPKDFDTIWASSHLPHTYGGLKVCYIEQILEPTMLPSSTETTRTMSHSTSLGSSLVAEMSGTARPSPQFPPGSFSLKLNDFIEAHPLSNHRRERFAGRIGLMVAEAGSPHLVMSTHVITEAILARSHRDAILGRKHDSHVQKLNGNWNDHVEIWAGSEKVSAVHFALDNK